VRGSTCGVLEAVLLEFQSTYRGLYFWVPQMVVERRSEQGDIQGVHPHSMPRMESFLF
jgi:hypothetical protein